MTLNLTERVPLRILVADDDRASLKLLSRVLARCNYDVVEASTGLEAWESLKSDDAPPIAILDWMMPGLDGIDVVKQVRELETDRPPYLILLTSKTDKSDIIAGLDAGANDYLTKPFHTGELHARVEVGRRMTELQDAFIASQKKLAHQASHDALTGLLNRGAILQRLEEELCRTRRHGGVVFAGMCDVDHFKHINDTYGHQAGDDVLCWLANMLTSCLRDYDAVGRLGGEEFLVIVPEIPETKKTNCFQRICERISGTNSPTREGALPITISIGGARSTAEEGTDDILARADEALYRAKAAGRDRVVWADDAREES